MQVKQPGVDVLVAAVLADVGNDNVLFHGVMNSSQGRAVWRRSSLR